MATYTVIGGWDGDEPVPVGTVAGKHDVYGGDQGPFSCGLWATSADGDTWEEAEANAVAEMRDTLTS